MTGLLHNTRDRRSSLSFCLLSLIDESGAQVETQSPWLTETLATSIITSCWISNAKCMIQITSQQVFSWFCSCFLYTKSSALLKTKSKLKRMSLRVFNDLFRPRDGGYSGCGSSGTTVYTTWASGTLLCCIFKNWSSPELTCWLAILFFLSSCASLRLFTARSIGCHVHHRLAGQEV